MSRLREILEDRKKKLERIESSDKIYDSPSWAYYQAHINGQRAELSSLLNLITF